MDPEPFEMDTEYGKVTAEYSIVDRIKAAVEEAKRDLEAPPSVLVVEKQQHKTLIVNIIDSRLVIYHQIPGAVSDGLEKIFDEPTDKFRAVLFLYCTGCRIFVMSKVLKLMLMQCSECLVSIRGGVIGLVELFRCVNSSVDVRSGFPLLTIELCSNVHIYQRNPESVYGVIGGIECTINSVDPGTGQRLNSYPVEDMFGGRRFYHLSHDTGVRWIEEPYILNNVVPHLIALPPEPVQEQEQELPFGTTPPTVGYFSYQFNPRRLG